mmetsp:Transcript_14389/g.47267  ORF Transcript_14389/g.47267 Transcript_14389/m.47267 type:complete len:253 (+) Transcript_14389:490-1248(+)
MRSRRSSASSAAAAGAGAPRSRFFMTLSSCALAALPMWSDFSAAAPRFALIARSGSEAEEVGGLVGFWSPKRLSRKLSFSGALGGRMREERELSSWVTLALGCAMSSSAVGFLRAGGSSAAALGDDPPVVPGAVLGSPPGAAGSVVVGGRSLAYRLPPSGTGWPRSPADSASIPASATAEDPLGVPSALANMRIVPTWSGSSADRVGAGKRIRPSVDCNPSCRKSDTLTRLSCKKLKSDCRVARQSPAVKPA